MGRKINLAVAILLIAAMALLLWGCGDSGKAKEYMDEGDGMVEQMEEESEQLESTMKSLLEGLIGAAQAGIPLDREEVNRQAVQIEKVTGELTEKGRKAGEQYEKIKGLSGVEEYKKYADMRLDFINASLKVLNKANDVADLATDAAKSGRVEAASVTSEVAEMGELDDELMDADEKADDYQKEKGL